MTKTTKPNGFFNFKKFISGFEKFGRIMILPISVLPLLGLMYGIGSIFSTISHDHPDQAIWIHLQDMFKSFGGVALWNLDIIFAVSIAAGLARQSRASAAVSGLVALFMLYYASHWILTMWSPTGAHGVILTDGKAVESWNKANPNNAIGNLSTFGLKNRFGKLVYDFNVMGGIIAGLTGYFMHKITINLKFHPYLSFFEGERLSPVASVAAAFAIGIPITFVWSVVNNGLQNVGNGLQTLDAGGSFLFGFFERLLIPFGLHHTINQSIYWTSVGGSLQAAQTTVNVTAGDTINGAIKILLYRLDTTKEGLTAEWNSGAHHGYSSLASMISDQYTIQTSTLWWCSGQFLMKVFGLTGAALAMLMAAEKKNRKFAASVIIGAVASSFITGITEPIEFTFLFISPLLFGVHALLAGLGAMTMSLLHISSASPAGGTGALQWLIFVVGNHSKFENWWGMLLVGPVMFAIYFIIFITIIKKQNIPTPGRAGAVVKLHSAAEAREARGIKVNKIKQDSKPNKKAKTGIDPKLVKDIIKYIGGEENIKEVANCISRLRITVKDTKKVELDNLKTKVDAKGAIIVAKQVQVIYGQVAADIKIQVLDELGLES